MFTQTFIYLNLQRYFLNISGFENRWWMSHCHYCISTMSDHYHLYFKNATSLQHLVSWNFHLDFISILSHLHYSQHSMKFAHHRIQYLLQNRNQMTIQSWNQGLELLPYTSHNISVPPEPIYFKRGCIGFLKLLFENVWHLWYGVRSNLGQKGKVWKLMQQT